MKDMNKNMNICPRLSIAAALLFATMFVSCIKAEFEAPVATTDKEISFKTSNGTWSPLTRSASEAESKVLLAHNPDEDGSFGLSMTVTDGIQIPEVNAPATKGVQVSAINSFDVAAYLYKNQSATTGSFFFEDQVTDGVTAEPYYWPSFGEMNFVALYPSGAVNGGVKTIADANGNLQSFDYTIPSDISQHQDLMIAVKNDVDCKNGGQVPLTFKHLLAAVQFKVGKMVATRINSLTISGVKGGTVTMTYDSANDTWSYLASSDNASYSPIYEVAQGTPNINTYGLAEGSYITSNDNGMVMFVMPQDLEGATFEISYYEYITGTNHNNVVVKLPNHSWEAGKTITYVINIDAETLQITIPTPPDADAHYVRVDMDYDLTGFTQYAQNVTISNVTATASWLNDGSNTASNDKQSIRLKKSIKNASGTVTSTELTEMQKQGYFTDELWETIIQGDTKNGPKLSNANILGTETKTLDITNKGTLHLFLDENDGDTDRNGRVMITAEVILDGTPLEEPIILGQGNFKQLHPYWNNGIGVERFEDGNNHPYGFNYNRKVVYTNVSGQEHLDSSYGEQIWNSIISWFLSLFGYTTDTVLPEIDEDIADNFVNVDKDNDKLGQEVIKTVTIDYSQLSNLKTNGKAISQDGLINTRELYDFTGNIDLADLEEQLNNSLTPNVGEGVESSTGWKREVYGSNESNPEYYAAYIALTRNKMRELKTTITDERGNEESEPIYQAIMHKENEGTGTNGVYEDGAEIIEWFLPSKEDAQNMKDVGTGLENTPISPLNGIYWSSTAGDDPVSTESSTSVGYAYTVTFNNNAYSSATTADRTSNHKVRAVRKKPTAN